jgi:hypothetical protein
MKFWRHQIDQEGHSRSGQDRGRHRARPGVESLEGRALLSTVHHSATTPKKQPAAFKPPAHSNPKFPPYDITVQVNPDSDPGGTGHIFQKNVLVTGVARPFAVVWLAKGLKPGYFTTITQADALGNYAFLTGVGSGSTVLQVFAENASQNYSNIASVTVTRSTPIVAWDSLALRAIQNTNTTAPVAARALAILHSAQYDAVAAVTSPRSAYQVHVTAPKGASAQAAANSAAYITLSSLFPSQETAIQDAYNAAVAGFTKSPSVSAGLALGREVANQTLVARANDGSNTMVNFPPSNVPGLWRPTPPDFAPAIDPQFAQVTPFEISSGSAFRPGTPPSLGSSTYDQALAQVASLGRADSTTRTSDQTAAAQFWNDGPGTYTSPGHWNEIAEQVAVSRKDSLVKDARLFVLLDFALADTAIASSDSQYTYDEWRPISAIHQADQTFSPLIATPASPSYVSENAAYGSAAAKVLSSVFGANTGFTDNLNASTGAARTFSSFNAAATENANSRIWGGVNFSFDAQAGVDLGTKVGSAVLSKFPKG